MNPAAIDTVLELLAQHEELYGLQLVELSEGKLKRRGIYFLLAEMEEAVLIVSRREPAPKHVGGIPRRLYRLAPSPRRVL